MRLRRSVPPRPRWSIKSSFVLAVVLAGTIVPVVLLLVHKSIWVELEMVTGIVAAMIFLYLVTILYLGVRFDRNERYTVDWPKERLSDVLDTGSSTWVDTGGLFTDLGSEAGVPGLVIGILLDLLASGLLASAIALVLWVGMHVAVAAAIVIFLPLFYLHRRVLRSVVAAGRACRGKIGVSVARAALLSAGYTAWFYAIVLTGHLLHRFKTG